MAKKKEDETRGRPPHEPTPEQRALVHLHSMTGTPVKMIARILNMSDNTLCKHYRDELDLGKYHANAAVAGCLFKKATKGDDTQAQIFWMKTQGRWRTVEDHNHVSEDGSMTPRPTTINIKAPSGS